MDMRITLVHPTGFILRKYFILCMPVVIFINLLPFKGFNTALIRCTRSYQHIFPIAMQIVSTHQIQIIKLIMQKSSSAIIQKYFLFPNIVVVNYQWACPWSYTWWTRSKSHFYIEHEFIPMCLDDFLKLMMAQLLYQNEAGVFMLCV